MLSQPLIQQTLGSNSLKGSSLELSEGLNYPGGLPLLVSVGKRLPYKWLSLGSSRGGVGGGALSRVHVATLTQPLAVSGRSGLFATMSGIPPTAALFAPPLLRNWRPPLDKLEA